MRAKEYLNQVREINRRIDDKVLEIDFLNDRLTSISVAYDVEPVDHSRNVHSLEHSIARVLDLKDELARDLTDLIDKRREVENTIEQLKDTNMKKLLNLRYLHFNTWEYIAVQLNFSIRNVYILHGKALLEIEKII